MYLVLVIVPQHSFSVFYNARTGCSATAISRHTIFRLLLTLGKTLQSSKNVFCFSYKPGQQYRSNCSHFGPLQKHEIEELQPPIHDNRKVLSSSSPVRHSSLRLPASRPQSPRKCSARQIWRRASTSLMLLRLLQSLPAAFTWL